MKVRISIAERRSEVLECQYFIAEEYNRRYSITFSEDIPDLGSRVEPYPQRYLMARHAGEVVGAAGLYTRDTYVERYSSLSPEELFAPVVAAGLAEDYANPAYREITKLVVREDLAGQGLARALVEAAASRAFLERDAERPVLLLICARVSVLRAMLAPRGRIASRFLASFPRYPVHSEYRSEQDPMENHLCIPALDIDPAVREQPLPLELELTPPPPQDRS